MWCPRCKEIRNIAPGLQNICITCEAILVEDVPIVKKVLEVKKEDKKKRGH